LGGVGLSAQPVLVLDAEFELESSFGQSCVEDESERDAELLWLAVGVDD
jgi:hypothetical protein